MKQPSNIKHFWLSGQRGTNPTTTVDVLLAGMFTECFRERIDICGYMRGDKTS